MLRSFACSAAAFALIAVLLESTSRAQPATTERVYYRDPANRNGPIKTDNGELKLSPAGYRLIADGKVKAVLSPADIVRVHPINLPGVEQKDLEDLLKFEINEEWEKSRQGYEELKKKVKGPQEQVSRFLDYKLAITSARAADETTDEAGWSTKAGAAAKMLDDFLIAYPSGWETWSAARSAAHLQMARIEKKRDGEKEVVDRFFEEAARTWGRVARSKDLPADLRQEAAFQEIDALIRGRFWAFAGDRLKEAMKTASPGASQDRLTMCQIAIAAGQGNTPLDAVPKLEAEIARTKDPVSRAVGHSLVGELYLLGGKPREAMWAFLWVEVVYNQSQDEVAKALFRLAEVFAAQGDEERARGYRDKARVVRSSL